ncbi:MAG: hypothetical protein AAFX50_15905, partial [Acidobacteriota bacterium]
MLHPTPRLAIVLMLFSTFHPLVAPATGAEIPFSDLQTLAPSLDGADAVALGDLDGDGDLDVPSAAQEDHRVSWRDHLDAAPRVEVAIADFSVGTGDLLARDL